MLRYVTRGMLFIVRAMPRVWDTYNQMIVSYRRAKRILQRLSLRCRVIKGGNVRTLGERNLGSMLSRTASCSKRRRLLCSTPSPSHSRQPDRCCAFGVYVSDIPITLIQEVVGSHAIYGRNSVELAREYIVACRSRRLRIPWSTARRVLRWFWIIRKPGYPVFLLFISEFS